MGEQSCACGKRTDRWIGDLIKTDRAIEAVGRLGELRAKTRSPWRISPS